MLTWLKLVPKCWDSEGVGEGLDFWGGQWYGGVDSLSGDAEFEAAVVFQGAYQAFDGLTTAGFHKVGYG